MGQAAIRSVEETGFAMFWAFICPRVRLGKVIETGAPQTACHLRNNPKHPLPRAIFPVIFGLRHFGELISALRFVNFGAESSPFWC